MKVKAISSLEYKRFSKLGGIMLLFGLTCAFNIVIIIYQTSRYVSTTDLIVALILSLDLARAMLFGIILCLMFDKTYKSLKAIRVFFISALLIFIIEYIILIINYGINGSASGASFLWIVYLFCSRRVGVYFNTGKYIGSDLDIAEA